MNADKIMRLIIVMASIGAIVKGVFLVGWPGAAAKTLRWWIGLSARLLRVVGVMMFLAGLCCIVVAALAAGNALITATLILGTAGIISGLAYHSPEVVRAVMRPWAGGNVLLLRGMGIAAIIVALMLLWVLLRQ